MNLREDLEQHYAAAMERVELLREEWERAGQPVIGKGSRGQPVPSPLLRALQGAERHADSLRRSLLPPSRIGRPPVAVFGASPAARLRAVTEDRFTRKR